MRPKGYLRALVGMMILLPIRLNQVVDFDVVSLSTMIRSNGYLRIVIEQRTTSFIGLFSHRIESICLYPNSLPVYRSCQY